MKKILLLTISLISLTVFGQRIPEVSHKKMPFDLTYAKKHIKSNLTPRAFTEEYWLNYGYVDLAYAETNNYTWGQTLVRFNSNNTKFNNRTISDVFQHYGRNGEIYDILGFTQQGLPVYKTIDLSKTNLKVDSFNISIKHVRNNNSSPDRLVYEIYETSNVTIPNSTSTGNGMPTSIIYGSYLWADSITLNSTLATNDTLGPTSPNPWIFTLHTVKPNLTLPVGKSFGLRLKFIGDTANYIEVLFSNHDRCNDACVNSSAFVSNTTGRQNYVFSVGTANEYDFSGTMNISSMFGCPAGSEVCDRWVPQNLMTNMYVTSTTDFNVKIDPVSNVRGCEGTNLMLASSYSGLDTVHKVSFLWRATRGTFENGKDTITSNGPTYTFDTVSGFQNIILRGTATNGEVASDTITVENWSMSPILTTTGKISCDPKDSVRMSIANSAAVGFSTNLLNAYDGITTLNLATNLNHLNQYFALRYEWSGTGLYPRTDTTFANTKTAGTFTLKITNFVGCSKTISRTFANASSLPTLDFSFTPSANICPNKDIVFKVASSALRPNWTYNWTETSSSLATSGEEITHQFPTGGVKSVRLSADSSGCVATPVTRNVTILPATDSRCKTSIMTTLANDLSIFPNPVHNGKVTIQNDKNQPVSYKVVDILGKVITNDKLVSNKESQIDLSNATNGVYFIELESKGEKIVRKLIVDKH